MSSIGWVEQANNAPFFEVALALGMKRVGKKGLGPCPACNTVKRGSTDKRGAVFPGTTKKGWVCISCSKRGDLVNLVSYSIKGHKLSELDKDGMVKVKMWFEDHGYLQPITQVQPVEVSDQDIDAMIERELEEQEPALTEDEVRKFWALCIPVEEAYETDPEIREFVDARGWDILQLSKLQMVRVTPKNMDWPEWWPKGRSKRWRLVVPAFNKAGQVASIHARSVRKVNDDMPKCLWPKGPTASGLLMANKDGVATLRKEKTPQMIIITEGLTDFVTTSLAVQYLGGTVAVLSVTSGSFAALESMDLPISTRVYVATDEGDKDKTGDIYAKKAATSLAPCPVRRLPITSFMEGHASA